jgi:hypothetical protein
MKLKFLTYKDLYIVRRTALEGTDPGKTSFAREHFIGVSPVLLNIFSPFNFLVTIINAKRAFGSVNCV